MSDTKFTPGPWLVDEVLDHRGNPCAYSVWPSHERQCQRNRIASTPDGVTAEAKANAHLIAAAPEMYEAAETALECLENNGFARAYVEDLLRNALRKARGEA